MEDVDLGVCAGRLYAGDPDRLAVVLPGARYLPSAPLLWYAREVVASLGWSVLEVWDQYLDHGVDPRHWVEVRAEAALERAGDSRVLLVAKSISSGAVGLAAERGLPGIWLTPLLNVEDIAAGFDRLEAPALVVGGTADESWVPEAAQRAGHEVLEIEGADHSLQLAGDPLGSIEALRRVVERADAFVAASTVSRGRRRSPGAARRSAAARRARRRRAVGRVPS